MSEHVDQSTTGGGRWQPGEDEVARVILDFLVQRYPALVAVDELVRELAEPSLAQRVDEPLIHDALVALVTSGLIHRLGGFVFPTLVAMRAKELVE